MSDTLLQHLIVNTDASNVCVRGILLVCSKTLCFRFSLPLPLILCHDPLGDIGTYLLFTHIRVINGGLIGIIVLTLCMPGVFKRLSTEGQTRTLSTHSKNRISSFPALL